MSEIDMEQLAQENEVRPLEQILDSAKGVINQRDKFGEESCNRVEGLFASRLNEYYSAIKADDKKKLEQVNEKIGGFIDMLGALGDTQAADKLQNLRNETWKRSRADDIIQRKGKTFSV